MIDVDVTSGATQPEGRPWRQPRQSGQVEPQRGNAWLAPVLTVDGRVYSECPLCESNGPHECVEVSGVLVIDCDVCASEFGWKG